MLVNRNDGRLIVVTGASRTGKTACSLQEVRNDKRVIAWDPQGDWLSAGFEQITDAGELVARLSNHKGGARICYKRPKSTPEFEIWAELAMLWGCLEPCTVVAEELAWVTNPNKAPPMWHELVTGGLKYGIRIIAITQRPSESDKTIMGNTSTYRCFRMQRANDRKYMAHEMDIDVAQITALKDLQYIEVNPGTDAAPEVRTLTF